MQYGLGVDPGSEHLGWSKWEHRLESDDLWTWCLVQAGIIDGWDNICAFVDKVDRAIADGKVSQVACEGYWLRPGLDALQQAGSPMHQVEVIGVLRQRCRAAGLLFVTPTPTDRGASEKRLDANTNLLSIVPVSPDHGRSAIATFVSGFRLKLAQVRLGG